MAGKLHILKTTEYQYGYLKKAADQAKLDGGTRMRPPPSGPTTDSNVITAMNVDTVDLIRGAGVSIVAPLRDPTKSETLSRFLGRKAVTVKRALINPGPTSGGNYPGDGHAPGPIAVTYEPIRRGAIGRIVVAGPAYAIVNVLETPAAIAYPTRTTANAGILDVGAAGMAGCQVLTTPTSLGNVWALVNVGNFVSPYATVYRCQLASTLLTGDATVDVDNLVPYDGIATNYDPTSAKTVTNLLSLEGEENDAAIIRYSAHDLRWDLLEVTC